MLPVELIRVRFEDVEGDLSALKLWTRFFPEQEPASFETDSDGDTHARGKRERYWIQFSRENDAISVYFTPEARTRGAPICTFEEGTAPLDDVVREATRIAEDLDVTNSEIAIYATRVGHSSAETLGWLMELAAGHEWPDSAEDVEMRITGEISMAAHADLAIAYQCTWRNGRRVLVEDGERSTVFAAGTSVEVRLTTESEDPIEVDSVGALLRELVEQADRIRIGGQRAL